MYRFEQVAYLLLLAAVPLAALLFLLHQRWKGRMALRIGDERLVSLLTASYAPVRARARFLLFAAALACTAFAAANLMVPGEVSPVRRRGRDIVLALDVSRSMHARDVSPDRLGLAKQLLARVMEGASGDRFALVLFAGRAYRQMPLSLDHASARSLLADASPERVPAQGTVIEEALRMCRQAFDSTRSTHRAVVLVTDGEDHDGDALREARALADEGIPIFVVGVGSAKGAIVTDPATGLTKLDAEGRQVVSRLDEPMLRELAEASSGAYIRLSDPETARSELLRNLSGLGTRNLLSVSERGYRSLFPWFIGGALLLLLAECAIPTRKRKSA